MIIVNGVCLSLGGVDILKDVTFTIFENEKAGLIGDNGAGKSTLLKIILGAIQPDRGMVVTSKNLRLGYVPQHLRDDTSLNDASEMTIREFVEAGRPLRSIQTRIDAICHALEKNARGSCQQSLLDSLDRLQEEYEAWGGYASMGESIRIIEGMGIPSRLRDQTITHLSGGDKSKALFARALYAIPDALLLDEPTNHLDTEARRFVTEYLRTYPRTVLCVSHDGEFLDVFAKRIIHLDASTRTVDSFTGNFSVYRLHEKEQRRIMERMHANQERKVEDLRTFIDRMHGVSGKRKRQAQSREKMLARIEKNKISIPFVSRKVRWRLNPRRTSNETALIVSHLNFSYSADTPLFADLSLVVKRGERLAIIGANGAGKTTLLKLLANKHQPNKGSITFGNKVDLGYFTQEHDDLTSEKTVLEEATSSSCLPTQDLRNILAAFLFTGPKIFQVVGTLSHGERSRLALAKLTLHQSNFLLLDEPTNHLDSTTRKTIALVLRQYGGTFIVVTHETDFLEQLGIQNVLILPTGILKPYDPEIVKQYKEEQ